MKPSGERSKKAIQDLRQNGYSRLTNMVKQSLVTEALSKVINHETKTIEMNPENTPFLNRDQRMVYNLQNKDHFFLNLLFSLNDIEPVLMHFLNDPWFKAIPADQPNYILRSYLARSSKAPLPLHIDSFMPFKGERTNSLQVALLLEPMRIENGCTLVVPGSHLSGEYANQESLKDAVPIEAEAGDVILWDSRLWHGASANNSKNTRWAVIATFTRWWVKQNFAITEALPRDTYMQLSDKEKAIMGYCSVPFREESDGIDMKVGYESLSRH